MSEEWDSWDEDVERAGHWTARVRLWWRWRTARVRSVAGRVWRWCRGYRRCVWVGTDSSDWNDKANWKGGRRPKDGDDVVVSDGGHPLIGAHPIVIHELRVMEGASVGMAASRPTTFDFGVVDLVSVEFVPRVPWAQVDPLREEGAGDFVFPPPAPGDSCPVKDMRPGRWEPEFMRDGRARIVNRDDEGRGEVRGERGE